MTHEPEWLAEQEAWLIKDTEHWRVLVSPMAFNHRILLCSQAEWRFTWTAGWCYDHREAAVLAARVFDPETDQDPVGFKKLAADNRRTHKEVTAVNLAVCGYV